MENFKIQSEIKSLEDVDREIDEVKKRLKLKEAELADSLNILPNKIFKYTLSSIATTVSSLVGGSVLLKVIGSIKDQISPTNKNTEEVEKNETNKKSFVLNSLKNVGVVGLLKIAARIIRYI